MKKSLTLVLAIAMVFTMFASVAFAADATTTASTDTQTKFDALKAAGVMTGTVVDGQVVAGLDLNMDRASFAEVLVNLYNLPKVATTSSFSDVSADHWALQQIEAAKTAGYMLGNGDGTFNPDGKITLQELASALCEANGLTPVANAEVAGADAWAAGYVAAAVNANLLASVSDYTAAATRADLVVGTYQTYENVQAATAPSATFSATGASKITVTFNKAIDKAKATFAVKKGNLPINVSSTTVAEDNMSAVINLATKMTKGDYTIAVTNPELSGTVTVDDEKVAKIAFNSDKASKHETDQTIVYTGLKVLNQYNEDVTSAKSGEISLTASVNGTATLASDGKVTIDSTTDLLLDQKISLSALDNTNGVFATTVLTVSPVAKAATITIDSLYNDDEDAVLDADTSSADVAGFSLIVNAKDQYGNDVSYTELNDDVLVYAVNPAVGLDVARDGDNNPNFSQVTIDGTKHTALALKFATGTTALTAGTSQIVVISKTTGNKATYDVVVKEVTKVDVLNLTAPQVAVAGETIEIPFTAVDQNGNAVTDADTLNNVKVSATASGIAGTIADPLFKQDYVNDKATLEVDTSTLNTTGMTTSKSLFLTAVTETNKVATLTLTLQPPAKPVVVTGVTDDTKKAIAKGASTAIDLDNVNVLDQYNRDYTIGDNVGTAVGKYQVKVQTSDDSVVDLDGVAAESDGSATKTVSANPDGDEFVLKGAAKGSATITISLVDPNRTETDKTIPNSAVTFTVKVVDKDSITGYSIDDLGTMYVGSASADYDKSVVVNGLLSDGTQVALSPDDDTYYTVTASTYGTDTGVTYTPGTTDFGVLHADGTALSKDIDDTTIPVTVVGVTKDGSKVYAQTVAVSIKAPAAKTVALRDGDAGSTKESDGVISINETDIGAMTTFKQLANDAVEVTDQYGVEIASATKFSNVIATNLPSDVSGITDTDLGEGDEFNITAITQNGLTISFKVVVVAD